MATCVVINDKGEAVNFIVADPSIEPPEGCTLKEVPEGFYWNGSAVVPIEVVTNGD